MGDDGRLRPLYSSCAGDPDRLEAIEAFVVGLAERVDHLQDLEREGSLEELASRADELAAAADSAGYQVLGDAARAVRAAGRDGKRDAAYQELERVTDLAQRVRLGHPGAF